MKTALLRSAALAVCVFGASEAIAGGEIFAPPNQAVTLGGTITSLGTSVAGKWVAEVFAGAGECLRVQVLTQFADLEAVVVAPDGTVFRNDDTNGAANRRPLVKIQGTPDSGWYTVSIGVYNGDAKSGNFTVSYGRYYLPNANCNNPTPPTEAAGAEVKK